MFDSSAEDEFKGTKALKADCPLLRVRVEDHKYQGSGRPFKEFTRT
jgi:hypothetical protein